MFGGKDAVVLVKKNFNPEKAAENFLREVFLSMGLIIKIETKMQDKHLLVDLTGDDMGILIGKRGSDTGRFAVPGKPGSQQKQRVLRRRHAGYRKLPPERRKETLETLAFNLAKKVKHTRKNVVLEPMNPYERRIIHSALQNDRYVTTFSEGEEPFRNVVIALKGKNSKPRDSRKMERGERHERAERWKKQKHKFYKRRRPTGRYPADAFFYKRKRKRGFMSAAAGKFSGRHHCCHLHTTGQRRHRHRPHERKWLHRFGGHHFPGQKETDGKTRPYPFLWETDRSAPTGKSLTKCWFLS